MTTQLDEDNYLTIQLLSYDRPTGMTERFYFHEMSTLQATTLLSYDKKIVSTKVVAYTDDNNYLDEHTSESFKSIGNFNDFFLNNPNYYIHNCDIELEDGLNVHSHDDGEVSITLSSESHDESLLESIFKKFRLDLLLIEVLRSKPGHYIAIDKDSKVTGNFIDFDDYVYNRRK